MSKDYYKILGVLKNASQEEIKRAFRRLAHQYHPDKAGGDEQKFKEINEAYQVLGNEEKRQRYNQFGADFAQQGGFGGGTNWEDFMRAARGSDGFNFNFGDLDLGDIFGDIFGGRRGRTAGTRKGNDISVDIEISLEEVFSGISRNVEINKNNLCSICRGDGAEPSLGTKVCDKCKGSGKIREHRRILFGTFIQESVCDKCGGAGKIPEKNCLHCKGTGIIKSRDSIALNIPAGIEDGGALQFSGEGEAIKNGVAGDLYVVVHIKPHKIFQRKNADLYCDLTLKFTQLALGCGVEIPAIDGNLKLNMSAGTEAGEMIQLKGKGLPNFQRYGRGDMYVKIKVKMPKKLSKNAKKLLEELDKEI
ncbi:MAG: molecular chaperone DnaJ [Parcubacteria group bacterium GW2011_GWA2_38_13b]|nr:MAG: molecular chaperone DnaJ [Parcubacteria group bacterium GW2011_GWA2_38_13b]